MAKIGTFKGYVQVKDGENWVPLAELKRPVYIETAQEIRKHVELCKFIEDLKNGCVIHHW